MPSHWRPGAGPGRVPRILPVVCAASALLFVGVAATFATSPAWVAVDAAVARYFAQQPSPAALAAAQWWGAIHSTAGIGVLTAVLVAVLVRAGAKALALGCVAAIPAGMLLNFGIKHLFLRERPSMEWLGQAASPWSFPSGHAAAAAVFYGAVVMALHHQRVRARWAATGVCVALCLATALSRLVLNVHYTSDVVAGLLEGIAWVTLCGLVGRATRAV